MDHPYPKEITIFFDDVGTCPECGSQFMFDPFGGYDGAFANSENMLVVMLNCHNPDCKYTMPFHIWLKKDAKNK